jgi:siderophore synthetase component
MPDVAAMLADLTRHRPQLVAPVTAALPGARAAVLARLWGALTREPVAGLDAPRRAGDRLTVAAPGGRELVGPAAAAAPYAAVPPGLSVVLGGRGYADPAELLRALRLPGAADRLAAELANSVANLALARGAGRTADADGPAYPDLERADPVDLEQLVLDGHGLHPCCRTRAGMSTCEVLAYAPEHRPIVGLHLVEVPADRWLATGDPLPALLPVHPWQHDHVLDAYPWLRRTGRRVAARPLMSLRTLAPVGERRRHLKTAVDVQMTSAVRTVSAAAVRNGPAVSALVADLARRAGALTVLRETGAGAVLVDGEPCRSLAVVVREAPRLQPGELAVPPAALAATAPGGRPPVVAVVAAGYGGDPAGYHAHLAATLLPPLLRLLHAGVALEAHGQNTLVVLRAGRPVRLLYRDVGGIRVSPARLRRHGVTPPPLHGDLRTDDPAVLRTKLAAAVVAGVLAEQVAVLSRECAVEPALLWAPVAAAVAAAGRRGAAAAGDIRSLLDDPLPVKATTAMRLADDPLTDRWAALPNPLAGTA